MRQQWITGLAAGLLLLIPAVLLGQRADRVDTERAALAPVPTETVAPVLESVPAPERTVSAIVVHEAAKGGYDEKLNLTVHIGGEDQEMCLSDYLCGVLMGEMPASFPLEALKAQAVAARTYTLRRLESGGVLSDDPAVCQAYCDLATAEDKFGEDADMYLDKLRQAVWETDGQVMTYDGALITATYFSCSGGRTESAQAVWGSNVPYLLSVDSPGEEDAGSYESQLTVEQSDLMELLEIEDTKVSEVRYTDGGGVESITLGGKTFTGVEIREKLGLRSTCFDLETDGDAVTFHVRGNGHRVGLSQYGAKAMAEAGSDYRAILTWYYTGAELSEVV